MTPLSPSTAALLLDPEAIENLRSLSPDDGGVFLNELITLFLADTPARIADLHRYRTTENEPEFIRAAHSIKGSSSNIGANELRFIAEQLEHHTRSEGLATSESQLAALEASFLRVKTILLEIQAQSHA